MARRTGVIFWSAVASAALLLGGGFATLRRIVAGGNLGDYLVLSVTIVALAVAVLVAGRIVLVLGRAQRRAREG